MATEERTFLPALRFRALTPLFDPVVRVTLRERAFKRRLLDAAAVAPGEEVLDIGCGTGTLALMLAEREPEAQVTGLDADPEILSRARAKAAATGARVDFVEGLSSSLPFEDNSFDVVLSSLFFHHLPPAGKRATAAEVRRVLRPGGRLHVADFGRAADPAMAAAFLVVRMIDGFETTADNARGALPAVFAGAGLEDARVEDQLRTPLGSLALYRAVRPPVAASLPRS